MVSSTNCFATHEPAGRGVLNGYSGRHLYGVQAAACNTMNDPIIDEARRARAGIAAEHGNDLHRIFEAARNRQGADGRPVVSFEPAQREFPFSILREEPPKRQ